MTNGIDTLITRLKNQFRKIAIPRALSYKISARYSQRITPLENSKNVMNKRVQTTIPIVLLSNEKNEIKNRDINIPVLKTIIIDFLPKHIKRNKPMIVATKLTIPIKAVTVVADMSKPLKTIFE